MYETKTTTYDAKKTHRRALGKSGPKNWLKKTHKNEKEGKIKTDNKKKRNNKLTKWKK